MSEANYDQASVFYTDFVEQALSSPNSVLSVVTEQTVEALGDTSKLDVCDLACGQGHLSRRLVEQGARVVGVDISQELLARAEKMTPKALHIKYVLDDAQSLSRLDDSRFDVVVSNMALMDIPDHKSAFENCFRILKWGGTFVFSILHPCFEAPFSPDNPPLELTSSGEFVACRINRYLEEGHWRSGGAGVRGRVGAYHRTLSTYLNDLIRSGFSVEAVYEPTLAKGRYAGMEEQWFSKVPRGLVIRSRRV